MAGSRVLAIAAGSGRIAYVLMVKGKPFDWRLSRKASTSPKLAATYAKDWIDRLRPDVVVTEKITKQCRKGEKTKALIRVVANVAANEEVFDVEVVRPCDYRNKYVEAQEFTNRFTELRPLLPRTRKSWEAEPRAITYFEALALALVVIERNGNDHG